MSYTTKYTVPFQSVSGIDYEVFIDVDGYEGTSTELIGGGDVFVTDIETGDVLLPVRSGSATLQVFGSDYLQDLYTSNPQEIRVRLMKGSELMWLGYMTPDTFSQDFSRPEFIYEIECVEALSTLKYKKFAETTATITFIQLIKNAATLAGYNDIYLNASVCGTAGENIYDTAYISCGNFYDELGEGMSYYEILEDIAKYLVCSTFTAYKGALYLLDYSAIRNSVNGYYKYDIAAGTAAESVTLQNGTTTHTLGYRGTGATLTRIPGKNKAVVNCSLYEVENILPEFDDEQSVFTIMRPFEDLVKKEKKIIRYYNQPKYLFYQYDYVTGGRVITEQTAPVEANNIGSAFVRTATYSTKDVPSSLSFDNAVLVQKYINTTGLNNDKRLLVGDKLFGMKSGTIILNTNTYLSVSFDIMRFGNMSFPDMYLPYQSNPSEKAASDTFFNARIILKIGNYYYNQNSWVLHTTGKPPQSIVGFTVKKDQYFFGEYYTNDNMFTYEIGAGDLNGFRVMPPPVMLVGELEFYICYEAAVDDSPYDKYWQIRNIKIDHAIQNTSETAIYDEWVKDGSKNDLIYENEISDNYIEEADEVDLKICTNPDYKLALSSVLSGSSYMGNIQSLSLGKTDIAENLILEKIISTFSEPRFKINPTISIGLKPYSVVTDEGLSGVTFVNCGGETDWKMDSTQTNLIQL